MAQPVDGVLLVGHKNAELNKVWDCRFLTIILLHLLVGKEHAIPLNKPLPQALLKLPGIDGHWQTSLHIKGDETVEQDFWTTLYNGGSGITGNQMDG